MAYPKELLMEIAVWASGEKRSTDFVKLAFDLSDDAELGCDSSWTYDDADVRSFHIGPPIR